MNGIEKKFSNVRFLDSLAGGDSLFHRLDTRILLLTMFVYLITVVSFDRYSISSLLPFFIFPYVLIRASELPARYLIKRLLWVLPFALMVGIFNPFLDKTIVLQLGTIQITGGMISFLSIIIKFLLTASIAIIIVSLLGIDRICSALLKFRVPEIFVIQIYFLYRYLFVLSDEAFKMHRAYSSRSFSRNKIRFKVYVFLIGNLLIRTFDRAERIYLAMCSRGFDNYINIVRTTQIGAREIIFLGSWVVVFVLFRLVNIPLSLGQFVVGLFS